MDADRDDSFISARFKNQMIREAFKDDILLIQLLEEEQPDQVKVFLHYLSYCIDYCSKLVHSSRM